MSKKDINTFLLEHRYDELTDVSQLNDYIDHIDNIDAGMVTEEKKDEKDQKEIIGKDEEKEVEKDKIKTDNQLEVVYAKKEGADCIFDNIILFTNDDDPKKNKTLGNVVDAIANIKKETGKEVKLYTFIAEELVYNTDDDNILSISDGNTELEFDKEDNTNTLVFSRLGVQGEDNCEHVVQLLQDRGFLVLNPVRYSQLASNKYDTAVLLQKGEIPQPNFCLMNKDILYDEKLFNESMKTIYKEWDTKDPDKNEDLKLVVKILDGHGGTGVALIDGKKLTAWLQLVFAVDKDLQLIIQRKEEADGGDIRVHVLTLRDRQVIMGAMKRVKIGGDFRSNVSLGASAEPVTLTPEQEQIALRTAKLSKLPWCAVDIMPLVKGSNKELGDNVVLEINASPGTDGISDVLKFNFVNIILNELKDPKEFYLQDKVAGYVESVVCDFGEGGTAMLAKLDTGNGASASHVEVGKLDIKDNTVSFSLDGKKYKLDIEGYSNAITGTQKNNRPVVLMKELQLGKRKVNNVKMALVESRDGKTTNVLLNRDVLSYLGYIVSPYQTHILTDEMEKIKII